MTDPLVPEGFRQLDVRDDFVGLIGPLWYKVEGDRIRVGLPLEPRHGNPMGWAHGGLLVTVADMVMGVGSGHATGIRWPHPTVSLSSEFVRGAKLGQWLEGTARIARRTLNFWQRTAYERTQHVGKASKDARAALAAGTAGLQIVPDSSSLQLAASIHCRVWNACSWTSLLEPCPLSLYPVSDSSLVFPPSLTPIALPAFPQELRRDGFDLCEERYLQLQPVLVEVGGWLAAGCWLGGCACGCALQADGRSGTHLS